MAIHRKINVIFIFVWIHDVRGGKHIEDKETANVICPKKIQTKRTTKKTTIKLPHNKRETRNQVILSSCVPPLADAICFVSTTYYNG